MKFQFPKIIIPEFVKLKNAIGAIINPATEDMQKSKVSSVNSTEQELAIGLTFTGEWEDCLDYSELIVSVHATENSATNGLVIEWSSNGVDVHGEDQFTISASSGKTFSFPCQNRYFRVKYTNNGTIQTHFDLQSILKRYSSKGSSHRLKDTLSQEDDATVTTSLIKGFSTAGGGQIVDVKVSPSGAAQVGGEIGLTDSLGNSINPATQENQTEMKSLLSEISDLVSVMKNVAYALTRSPSIEGNTGRMRVSLEGGTGGSVNLNANQTLGTVTTVGNVNTLGGSISTVDEAYAINRVSWSQNVGNRIP